MKNISFGEFLEKAQPLNPKASEQDLFKYWDGKYNQPAIALKESRAPLKDAAASFGTGVNQLASGLYSTLDFASDGTLDKALGRKPSEFFADNAEALGGMKSPYLQAQMASIEEIDGFTASAKAWLSNPYAIANMTVETLPSFVPGIGAAAVTSRAKSASVFRDQIAKGVDKKLAAKMASDAGIRSGTFAAITADTSYVAGMTYGERRDRVLGLSEEELAQIPGYAEMVESGMTDKEIRDVIANDSGRMAAAIVAPITALSMKLSGAGRFMGDIGAGNLAGKGIAGKTVTGISRGIATESPQEMMQSGGENFAGNLSEREYINRDQSLTEGLGSDLAAGMIIGGAAGGAVGAGSGAIQGIDQSFVDSRINELQTRQKKAQEVNDAAAQTKEQVKQDIINQGGDALDLQLTETELGAELAPEIIQANAAAREAGTDAQSMTRSESVGAQITNTLNPDQSIQPEAPQGQPARAEQVVQQPVQQTAQTIPAPQQTAGGERVTLQNRNRSTPASIAQMNTIASNPDYGRLGFSRSFGEGSPVVEPGASIPQANMGKTDFAATADGRRIPVQYAVVEAGQLLPSNRSDGTQNEQYQMGAEGFSRAIAGNGRVAGLQNAYGRGTTEQYKQEMMEDAAQIGISPDVIAAMEQPVLVRIMPKEDVTPDIGDISNTSGVSDLTPSEQARNDAKRVDAEQIPVNDEGQITRQAAMAFVNSMPEGERSGLLDGKEPNRKAYERLENLLFSEAFDSPELLRLQSEATDTEVRTIMAGLRIAASKLARLKEAGDLDIRDIITEAAEAAVNAKRSGKTLADFIQQTDLDQNPETLPILKMMAENIRSAKRIGENLSNLADVFYAESQVGGVDMFGVETVPRSRAEMMRQEFGETNEQQTSTQDTRVEGRARVPDTSDERADQTQPESSDTSSEDGAATATQASAEVTPETEATEQAADTDGQSKPDQETQAIDSTAKTTDISQDIEGEADYKELTESQFSELFFNTYQNNKNDLIKLMSEVKKQRPDLKAVVDAEFEEVAHFLKDSDNRMLKVMAQTAIKRSEGTAEKERVMSERDGDLAGLVLSNSGGTLFVMFSPDASEPGRFRTTMFSDIGFTGHSTRDSYKALLDEAFEDGYRKEDKTAFARMAALDSFSKGNEYASIIQRFNSKQIDTKELAAEMAAFSAKEESKGAELTLQPQTQAEIDQQQAEQTKAQQEAAEAEKKADERAKADSERDSFGLTGSDSKRDVMAQQGQTELDMSEKPKTSKPITTKAIESTAGTAQQAESSDSIPVISTLEQLEALPTYDIYKQSRKSDGAVRYLVRGNGTRGTGDSIHDTLEEAQKESQHERRRAKDEQAAQKEREAGMQAEAQATAEREADNVNGFTDGMTPLQAGRVKTSLGKEVRINGEETTYRAYIDGLNERGELSTSIQQEPKIKPMSRRAYNRADQRQQDDHARRMAEAGNKSVYYVNDVDLGKTAYDYANHILGEAGTTADTAQQGQKATEAQFNFTAIVRDEAGQPFFVNNRRNAKASLAPFVNGKPEIHSGNPTVNLSDYTFANEWWNGESNTIEKRDSQAETAQQTEQRDDKSKIDELNDLYSQIGKDDSTLFSMASPRNLYVAHNLSASGLKFANELGGLAAPSLAVAKTDAGFDNFGEITLLAEPDILNDAKARTFDADVYTPRQPRAEHDLDFKKYNQLVEDAKNDFGLGVADIDTLRRTPEDFIRSQGVQYAYLKGRDMLPKSHPLKAAPEIKKAAKIDESPYQLERNPQIQREAKIFWEKIDADSRKQLLTGDRAADVDSIMARRGSFNPDGSLKDSARTDFVRKAVSYRKSGGVDATRFARDLAKKMRVKSVSRDYQQWAEAKYADMSKGKVMFKGFTPDGGRRKYAPYTLENVVKEMTKTVQGGETFNYGAGSIRSMYANRMKNVAGVQKNRDRIIAEKEFEALKEESNNKLVELLDALRPAYKFDADGWGYLDDASAAIGEGPIGWREAFDLTDDVRKQITDFVTYLSNMPTAYFESKMQRSVDLSEFKVAVVPKGTDKATLQILRDKGIKVKYYDPSIPQSRTDTIKKQEDILFSQNKSEGAGITAGQATETLSQDKLLKRAIDTGKLKVVQSADALPSGSDLFNSKAGQVLVRGQSSAEADGQVFETGKPVTFNYAHNTESATDIFGKPDIDSPYGRGYEPSGQFVSAIGSIPASNDRPNMEYGEISFKNPLVVLNDDLNWKKKLSEDFGGKRGKALSKAVIADGYDGIVTIDTMRNGDKYVSEIVNLQTFDEAKAKYSKAGAVQGAYKDGTAYVIADGNTDSTLKQTAWHELTHAALDTNGDTFIQPAQKQKLFNSLDAQVKLARNSKKDSPLKRAIKRTDKAGTSQANFLEEVAGYLVTDYVNTPDSFTGQIKKWIDDFIGAIQAAVLRYSGIQIGRVTGAELNAIARAYADYVTLPDRGRTSTGDALASRGGQTDTPAFKKWFGDSVVVDENGEPMVVYHGTGADFSVFDPDKMSSVTDSGWYGKGFYFTPNQDATFAQDAADSTGGSANVMPVYLSIKNPVYADAYAEQGSDMVRMAKERGRDGVIVRYPSDHEKAGQVAEIIVWDNNQIKSATGNQGTFNPDSDNILLSRGGQTDTPAFKKWFGDSVVVDENGEPLVVYHGTEQSFTEFNRGQNPSFEPRGFYFSPDESVARNYSQGTEPMAVYLSIENPYRAESYMEIGKMSETRIDELQAQGFDGAVFVSEDPANQFQTEYVAFESNQIKSVNNNGNFSTDSDNILLSRAAETDALPIGISGPAIDSRFKRFATLRGFFESASDLLNRTPGLEPLGEAVRVYYDQRQALRAEVNQYERIIRDTYGKLKSKERKALDSAFSRHRAAVENGRTEEAATIVANAGESLQTVIDAWQQMADVTGNLSREAGVKVKDAKTGKYRLMGRAENFWPRTFTEKVQMALDNPNKHPEQWNRLVEAIQAQRGLETAEEAAKVLRTFQAEQSSLLSDNDYFAGIEKGRSEQLPEIFYDYSINAGLLYKEAWADRLAQIQAFGQSIDGGRTQQDMFDEFLASEKGIIDDQTRNYIMQVRSRAYNEKYNDAIVQFTQTLNTLATGIQLGNPATALLNIIGGTALTFQAYGIRRALKELVSTIGNFKKYHSQAYDLGILSNDYLSIQHDSERSGVPAWLRQTTAGLLKIGGYTPAEHFIRTHNMVTGMAFLRDAIDTFNTKPDSTKAARYAKWIQRQGFDMDQLLAEGGSGKYTDRFIRSTVNLTQGSYKIDQTPIYVDTPIGRVLFKYQKFGTQLSRMFWNHHLSPFVDTITGDNKVAYTIDGVEYSQRLVTFMPLLRFFAVAVGAGAILMDWREELFGYQNKAPTWSEIDKALADDETARAIAFTFERAYQSGMSVGMFGFFGNYMQLANDIADRQRFRNPLDPPALAPMKAVADLALRAVDQGELTARDIDSFAQQAFSIYRTAKRGTANLGADVLPFRELQVEAAKADSAFVRKMTRRYAAANDLSAKRRAQGSYAATVNSPFNNKVVDAILVGETAKVRLMVRDHFRDRDRFPTAKERDSAMLSLKSSVRARDPSRVGVAPSEIARRDFLRWAKENTSAEEYARIQRVTNEYRRNAQLAGLL